jgi:hypothetical protein
MNTKTVVPLRKIVIHVFGCVSFMLIPLIASPRSSIFQTMMFGPPELKGLLSSFLLLVFFYVNYYLLIPEFYQKKKYLILSIITLVFFLLILFVPNLFVNDFYRPDFHDNVRKMPMPDQFGPVHQPMKRNWLFGNFQFQEMLLKFFVVWFFSFLVRTNEFLQKSKEEKNKTEIAYLKSQVNPHFLFNTLNGIYALSLINSEKTPEAIVKLSDLMRYVISEIDNDLVPLKTEIQYIENYIDLQKMRLGNTIDVRFTTKDIKKGTLIAPALLIPFVENAFKFGVSNESIGLIEINLSMESDTLICFDVSNMKFRTSQSAPSSGIGISNVRRRLQLSYPERHELKTHNTDNNLKVELKIRI